MAAGTEAQLPEPGHVLPALPAPGGDYVRAKTLGHTAYLGGVVTGTSMDP